MFSGTNSAATVNNTLLVEQQVEEYYNSKLWNLMVNSGVYDEVSVSSNLAINLSETEKRKIEYYSNDTDDTGPKENYYYYVAENENEIIEIEKQKNDLRAKLIDAGKIEEALKI